MAKRVMVTLIATALANTTVRGENARYNVHTNPDDPDAAELELDRKIAVQLVKAGVGRIEGEDPEDTLRQEAEAEAEDGGEDDGATGQRGGTIERAAARRLRRSLDADNAGGPSVSGADSRDTTAFRRDPLGGADRLPDRGGDGDDDAAPLDGANAEGAPGRRRAPPANRVQPGAKTPAAGRKRVRNRSKKAAGGAAGGSKPAAGAEGANQAGADAPES